MMANSMKRWIPWLVCIAGIGLLALLWPRYDLAHPRGIRITRAEALRLANAQARRMEVPLDKAWPALIWAKSDILEKELRGKPDLRRRADADPVVGPELGWYRVIYYRRGLEKNPEYASIDVSGQTGAIVAARLKMRPEERGAHATEAELRPLADAFVRTHKLTGVAEPEFDSARPMRLSNRTDWLFRYKIRSDFPLGAPVGFYLNVHFTGDKYAGWSIGEEYVDGSNFRPEDAGIASTFVLFLLLYVLLLILLIIFLRKYHAGEVGVGTGTLLFSAVVVGSILFNWRICAAASVGTGFGSGIDAAQTAVAGMGFKFLFFDLPIAVLVFLAWSVGESFARERWGERLASFDSILRRDAFNATVGRSVLRGVLTAPGVAAAGLLIGVIPLLLGMAHPTFGGGNELILGLGGPWSVVINAALDSITTSVVVILFILAAFSRRRWLALGIVATCVLGAVSGVCGPQIAPQLQGVLFGFGGALALAAVFLSYDLLTTAVSLFGATLIIGLFPFLRFAAGDAFRESAMAFGIPLVLLLGFAVAGLMTRREIVYKYSDLAIHVKRIVERERVKAEIDAANRIQAALLPIESPPLVGATVASHYRAATEIGGDYFDFLPQPTGEVGIAFGDVSGHGLTSGIVMAMAKAALLVQVDYDSSPRAVLDTLNDIVIRTAPKRILMTFFFGLLDPQSQKLTFSSAGHLDPYVYRAATKRLESLSSWGFPLGVKRREPFLEHEVSFCSGDRLILYSDGLIEAVDDDGEPFGFERFEQVLLDHGHKNADEIKKALLQAVKRFTRNRPPEDDQTLVVVGFESVVEARLPKPPTLLSVAETRAPVN
jgi:hypothetical protein